jgi:hypothetical protein
MKIKNTCFKAALTGAILASTALAAPAFAEAQLFNWGLNTAADGLGGALQTGINQLNFNGDSYITTTAPASATSGTYAFSETGVYNFSNINSGTPLALNGGELTAVFVGSGSVVLGGNFTFTSGYFDVYYATAAQEAANPYGGSTNTYGATTGTEIGAFTVTPGGGGSTTLNGLPSSNGQVTVNFTSNFAPTGDAGVWLNNLGVSLPNTFTLAFITTNASEDNSTPDANLAAALATGTPVNQPPSEFLVSENGQFKLAVPEPTTLALLGIGLIGASFRKRSSV